MTSSLHLAISPLALHVIKQDNLIFVEFYNALLSTMNWRQKEELRRELHLQTVQTGKINTFVNEALQH